VITVLLILSLSGVTPGEGWSWPIVVTEEPNTTRPNQLIHRDDQGRFHMVWADYAYLYRIGYKVFLQNGSTVVPDTMISRDVNSMYLTKTVISDSLFAFWREYNPVYYAIRSLEDGSEVTPATYLFTTYTLEPYICACPDFMGRLHVLYNSGSAVYYAVWAPAAGGGFITEYEWLIPDAFAYGCGHVLVDGNRVHVIVHDDHWYTCEYLQYDLDGNLVIPQRDFTANDIINTKCTEVALDSNGDLLIIDPIARSGQQHRYVLWKLDGETGETIIDEKEIVVGIPPVMDVSVDFILKPLPGSEEFYLCWIDGAFSLQIWYMVIDASGNVLKDWSIAYDHSDEDPEQLAGLDGVVDDEGNLYIIYGQGETEPVLGRYPTFGWFDHTYLGIEEGSSSEVAVPSITASCNPVAGSVQFTVEGFAPAELEVYDIAGRLVAVVSVSDGAGVWNCSDLSGNRLPNGVYSVTNGEIAAVVTILVQ
jgi:hypothetical protein